MSSSDISERTEDYLWIIHRIIERNGFARIKSIAFELKVKPSSVVEMMDKLQSMGLVVYEKYGGVKLSDKGKVIGQIVRKRHETIQRVLEMMLVPKEVALKDAHILEEELDPMTILQLARFVKFMADPSRTSNCTRGWAEEFKEYCSKEDKKGSEAH